MSCKEESCFGDLVAEVTLPLRCLVLIKRAFQKGYVTASRMITRGSENAVTPCQDRKFKVQQTPVTMLEVIEIVSDTEEEET